MRIVLCLVLAAPPAVVFPQEHVNLKLTKTIYGSITPKSIVYAGNGLFFAQNMMYSHTISVYDRQYRLVKTIDDKVDLSKLTSGEQTGIVQGAPVEAAVSDSGKYVWVTNYRMYGDGFANPGDDDCGSKGGFDSSFVYRVDTKTLRVDAAVSAGSVPKYIAITPDNKYVLVSNWCSGDMSVINLLQMKEVRRIKLGLYPRGIAVDSKSQHVYVAIMGSDKIARVNLHDFTVRMLEHIGRRPRHLCVSSDDKFLFASLNGEHKVVKIDLSAKKVIASVKTGLAPRSMTLSPDNQFLYVVNYGSGNLSVIRTADMRVAQNVATKTHPIGVAYDPETDNVWVACYSGCIQVFENVQEDVPVPASVRNSEPDFQYHIIVGAFRQEQNLKKMMSRCVKAGYKPYVVKSNGALKKLSCKGFDDKESALNELSKLKELFGEGIWILKQPMMTQAAASQSSN